jgi:hypothetical protein
MTIINAFNDYYHRMQPRIISCGFFDASNRQKRLQQRLLWYIIRRIQITEMNTYFENTITKKNLAVRYDKAGKKK